MSDNYKRMVRAQLHLAVEDLAGTIALRKLGLMDEKRFQIYIDTHFSPKEIKEVSILMDKLFESYPNTTQDQRDEKGSKFWEIFYEGT